MVSVTAHGERGPGFDPGQGRLSFLSEISLNSAMCFANNPFTCGRRCQTPWGNSPGILQPGDRQLPMIKQAALVACRQPGGCWRIPYIGSERKNSVRKTGERYKHREEKSGSVALRPVEKLRPSTAYGAFQPHTRAKTRVPGQWVGYSCAVPGCHNSVGQMSPGRTQLLLLHSIKGCFKLHFNCENLGLP